MQAALAAAPADPGEMSRLAAQYFGNVSHVDEQLGRIVAALRLQAPDGYPRGADLNGGHSSDVADPTFAAQAGVEAAAGVESLAWVDVDLTENQRADMFSACQAN